MLEKAKLLNRLIPERRSNNGPYLLVDAFRNGICHVYSAHDSTYTFRRKRITTRHLRRSSEYPYAVLGALIFPAILFVQEGNITIRRTRAGAAFLIAILGGGVMSVVLGTIGVLAVYSLFM